MGQPIGTTLADLFARADLIFITGGLGPTTDDVTREMVVEQLGLELIQDERILAAINDRLKIRGFRVTDRILRQAQVPVGRRGLA